MKKDIDNQIKSAVSKKLRESKKESLFEGIESYTSKTLDEFFSENDRDDYVWDEDLEEILYEEVSTKMTDQQRVFKVGDIIMTQQAESSQGVRVSTPHRILVISAELKDEETGIIQYEGYLLSTKMNKSNKMGGYPNNIYINNYGSILDKGPKVNKEAFIRVDDIIRFTNKDLDVAGSWKGHVNAEFKSFIEKCAKNYLSGVDNSKTYWIR